MRFALRNHKKISDSLGAEHLSLLLRSLEKYFNDNPVITEHPIDNGRRSVIFVPSVVGGSEIEFRFVIIGKMYDVYTLAFYGSIG